MNNESLCINKGHKHTKLIFTHTHKHTHALLPLPFPVRALDSHNTRLHGDADETHLTQARDDGG